MKSYPDIMIDIETLAKKAYPVIFSIGAVEFDIFKPGSFGRSFYVKIDPQSCEDHGLVLDVSTVLWWMKQNEAAKAELLDPKGRIHIKKALNEFKQFMKKGDPAVRVWANSPTFDCAHILEAYERVLGEQPPWSYRQPRDQRTIMDFYTLNHKTSVGVAHHALDDCRYQIDVLRLAVSTLGIKSRRQL